MLPSALALVQRFGRRRPVGDLLALPQHPLVQRIEQWFGLGLPDAQLMFTASAARRSSIRISGGASAAASGSVGAAVNGKAMKGASPGAGVAAGLWLASRHAARRHL